MKKIIPLALVVILLSLNSCSKSPNDKIIDIMESYTSKVEKASSEEDLENIQKDFTIDLAKFQRDYSTEDLKEADKDKEAVKKVEDATAKLYEAVAKKKAELE